MSYTNFRALKRNPLAKSLWSSILCRTRQAWSRAVVHGTNCYKVELCSGHPVILDQFNILMDIFDLKYHQSGASAMFF